MKAILHEWNMEENVNAQESEMHGLNPLLHVFSGCVALGKWLNYSVLLFIIYKMG